MTTADKDTDKRTLVEEKTVLLTEGQAEEAVILTKEDDNMREFKGVKRLYSSRSTSSDNDSSSNSGSGSSTFLYNRRSRAKTKLKDDEKIDIKPTFPPPIDLTITEEKSSVSALSYSQLKSKDYYIDKTEIIEHIYKDEARAKYYCFPRAGSKSTVASSLLHWFKYDDSTREQRLENFEGSKILTSAKGGDGSVQNGSLGFNNNIVIKADFAAIKIRGRSFPDIVSEVTKEFCNFLRVHYGLSSEAKKNVCSMKPDDTDFFFEIATLIKDILPNSSNNLPVLLIIDNFDAPVLRILNGENSIELADKVMGFFSDMLTDVIRVDDNLFSKIILFGTHQPLGMNTKSVLKKIPVVSYPYGKKELVTNFFFSSEDVRMILAKCGDTETSVEELSRICGQYHIQGENYFHPGCIINFVTREKTRSIENPTYWYSLDSLDILADTKTMLQYEFYLWTLQENEVVDFDCKSVLKYENINEDKHTAFTYLLEAGYLTPIKDTDPPTYRIVNAEARNLFASRYKQWKRRIPLQSDHSPIISFEKHDYDGFFKELNNILKKYYAGEDFRYEGQYHVFVSSFFHDRADWHFKSNNQAGYGRYDFITWSKNQLADTGYVFEIARVKETNSTEIDKRNIMKMMKKKIEQVTRKEYFICLESKAKLKCIVVVGCQKRLSFSIFNIMK